MTSDRRPRGTQPQPDRQRRQHAQGEDLAERYDTLIIGGGE